MTRREFLAAGTALAAVTSCRGRSENARRNEPSAPPEARDPGVPQVLLVDAADSPSFAAYLEEMLGFEGVIGIRRIDGRQLRPATLATYPAVVVYGPRLSASWPEAIDAYVSQGGTLVAIGASSALLSRFGITESDGPGVDARGVALGATDGSDGASPLRLHVEGRRWRTGGGKVEAVFTGDEGGSSAPAIVRVSRGSGTASFWAFDVARNVALIRQGNPAWAGQDRDGDPGVCLVDAMVGWIRPETLGRPEADLLQRAVTAAVTAGTVAGGPLLRTGYFPGDARAILVATADAHGIGAGVLEGLLRRVEAAGGRLSVYYAPPPTPPWRQHARRLRWALGGVPLVGRAVYSAAAPPSPRLVEQWRSRGHEFAPHPTVDHGLEAGLAEAWAEFEAIGYGTSHVSVRTHKVLWSGWATTAKAQRTLGVRMNLDAYHMGPALRRRDGTWAQGHLIGSGLPMRMVDESGAIVDCYQQPTQIVDEHLLGAFGGAEGRTGAEAAAIAAGLIERAVRAYPAALCGQFHADGFAAEPRLAAEAAALLDGTLEACRRARVPVWTASRWLAFVDGRRASALQARRWDPATRRLACELDVGLVPAADIAVLAPATLGGQELREVRVDGEPAGVSATRQEVAGWVRILVRPGRRRMELQYA